MKTCSVLIPKWNCSIVIFAITIHSISNAELTDESNRDACRRGERYSLGKSSRCALKVAVHLQGVTDTAYFHVVQ